MLPCAFGGTERHSNLRLLPNDCHVDGHKRLSRKRMALQASKVSLTSGESFTLTATVKNSGDDRSAATTVRYYRSSDSSLSKGNLP